MTPWHYRWLCQFSYMNLPRGIACCRGETLGGIAKDILDRNRKGRLECGALSEGERETLSVIQETKALNTLRLVDFINRNDSTGLAAYIFRSEDDGIHMIFRGSESRGCGIPNGIDWLDNFLAPFQGSVQYAEIDSLARRYPEERVTFSGHSKGAHNALYALSCIANPRAQAVVFNGQGFAPGQMEKRKRRRLAGQGVNYVVRGDLVGVLLSHPERRIFVKKQGAEDPHALSSLSFDRRGQPVEAHRTLWSYAVEWGTSRYVRSRQNAFGGGQANVEML